MAKRVYLLVLDSFGIGNAPDVVAFGDEGSNTLAACATSSKLDIPNMRKLGLYNIDGVELLPKESSPLGAYGRLVEQSKGKDTTIGHWEIAGVESPKPLPVFPNGFPSELIEAFEERSGYKVLCNKPYSGTKVLEDLGEEHMRTGALIVYTSADSVFQIAANEAVVPLEELYRVCELARKMLTGGWAVGRVIARPFIGTNKENFARTPNRHDYSLLPPAPTILDGLCETGYDVIGVGKIFDIFAGQGITKSLKSKNNTEGMQHTIELAKQDFTGLAFINLVDFDMVYGHRNDVDGYANALTEFDKQLGELLPLLGPDDLLLITADHGCDPSTPSTDHSRECVPLLAVGQAVKQGVNLETQSSFASIANTISAYFGLDKVYAGQNLWPLLKK